MKKLKIVSSAKRINAFLVVFAIALTILVARAVQIQGIDSAANAQKAAAQLTHTQVIKAQRGQLRDRNGKLLAESQPAFSVIGDPTAISTNGCDPNSWSDAEKEKAARAPKAIADILIRYLGGKTDDYLPKLTDLKNPDGSPKQYVVLKRKVAADLYQQMAEELAKGGWYGIYRQEDPARYYPNGQLAASIIGFTNDDGDGQLGLEAWLNDDLKGEDGKQTFQSSIYGEIPLGEHTLIPAKDGNSYDLTIDSDLQWMAEQELTKVVAEKKAKSGFISIMAVKTGEVLALANEPGFDANNPGDADPGDLSNRAITQAYEPGSVEKVLTFAALLDAGVMEPDTQVEVPSRIWSGSGYITDSWQHGTLPFTARGVLSNSSNIGTVELARQIPKADLSNYLSKFGFGSPTGIQLPGESDPMGILPGTDMADFTRDQIAFGQGLSLTGMQMTAALSAVTNGGVYHAPTIIKSGQRADGSPIDIASEEPRRVISEEASKKLVSMMEATIASPEINGYQKRLIPGYRVGGKSGTAQKIGAFGAYDGGYTGSYAVVAPVEDPQILVYVVIDEPKNGYYGETVAFPSAQKMMQLALPRYGVAPSASVPEYSDPLYY
uniref:peptidoglycan D,D-transpeptidase FtsI family protein n=1 Tax=Vaginimicrobium propionicum TaxID=1871034 RepID=UPI000970F5A4|nr:penicillin-binding protein 2 [Vaginimicrobium propionicum]